MLGGLAVGETEIHGLLEGGDVLATARAMAALGARVERGNDAVWRVNGVGVGGLKEPAATLDMGNAGTGARLLMGIVASHPITCQFTGDESLCARPMGRIATPLEAMGARIVAREGCRMPLTVIGSADPLPITYRLPMASAQVKSAVLLAGLNAPGETTVIEPSPTRDHSERMLGYFGATLRVEPDADGAGQAIVLDGQPELSGRVVTVPGDPSSAAFLTVAALVVPGSSLTLCGVGVNPLRSGLFTTLNEMGAGIEFSEQREENGEPVADLIVRAGTLSGVDVPAERAPSMIDEYPVLAVAAACAEGETVMRGLAELRVKESDRLAAMVEGLRACGVDVEAGDDSLTVKGDGGLPPGGGAIAARLDHRIAMAFLVLGMAARRPVTIDNSGSMDTSFPGFAALCNGLGAAIS
jgi:3-phosphoshikimate 1-carboxyvinyltransferase